MCEGGYKYSNNYWKRFNRDFLGKEITEDQKQFTKKLFENTSKIYEFTEDYLDIFLALTSSGPAIIALIIEALSDGGLSGGLPK